MAWLAATGWSAPLDTQPTGEAVELHSCELFTGGCIASSQETLGGRTAVRAWHFTGGQQNGVALNGLTVVALEVASANLALPETKPDATYVYLPKSANDAQRQALLSWLASNQLKPTQVQTVPITYARQNSEISLRAGARIALKTRAIEACETGMCGESLWYEPGAALKHFTVLVDEKSAVNEPGLRLTWDDHAQRSVFFGQFGTTPLCAERFTLAMAPMSH